MTPIEPLVFTVPEYAALLHMSRRSGGGVR
jgi:hypothetical protein